MIRIYFRVSTDKQDFDMQDKAIRELLRCKNINYDSCSIYQDFGISGTTTQRPDYQRLLSEVKENDTVVCYEFSRLWRDLEEQSRVTKMLLALNINLVSVADGEINKLIDTIYADIKGSINQFEARRLKERTIAGIQAKKAKISLGLDSWNGRGKDKKPRSREGYFKRWEKARAS